MKSYRSINQFHIEKWNGYLFLAVLAFLMATPALPAQKLQLEIGPASLKPNGWAQIRSAGLTNYAHQLFSSTNLRDWQEMAVLHEGPFDVRDWSSPTNPVCFYRSVSHPRTVNDDGKNQIGFPVDNFLSPFTGIPDDSRWIKFAIVLREPGRVWFQDSGKYLFHYDWAIKRIPACAGLSRAQFDNVSLHTNNQQVVLGAVLFPPTGFSSPTRPEFGIQFVGLDPYSVIEAANWFRWVRAAVYPQTNLTAYYMPVFEQRLTTLEHRAVWDNLGIAVSDINRWISQDIYYSDGWALGRLIFIPADQIAAAYADGRLKPADILTTDGIPAEIPFVSGIITTVPATPNSHVAILARSYHIPFLFAADPAEQARVRSLAGREVLYRVHSANFFANWSLSACDADLDPALRADILALKAPGTIHLAPKVHLGLISTNLDQVIPADIRFMGGKAANFGVLRRAIPSNSPPAIAFSFDLWDAFMDQVLPNSTNTLRQEIHARTAAFAYPPDVTAARTVLAGIRALIQNTAHFSEAQKAQIIQALLVFDPGRKIRFRSSTNVEDSEQFTGAGLYDSFSGCLADDLDQDDQGPSQCDPLEPNERGVFRAMQRVYASFYNDNAWLERLRFGLNEDDIGMAILAHHSFPDGEEMANGVATITVQKFGASLNYTINLVTQLGAVSVTNPDGAAIPEVVYGSMFDTSLYLNTVKRSSLVPLGGNVMTWEQDYSSLVRLLAQAVQEYLRLVPGRSSLVLDFEYKKLLPGHLEVKQIREIPQPQTGTSTTPFLLNQAATYVTQQGEMGDVFAIHRLKCRLTLNTENLRLHATNLTRSFYRDATMQMLQGTNIVTLTNGLASWPEAQYAFESGTAKESWTGGTMANRTRYSLATSVIQEVDLTESPLLTQLDFTKTLNAAYAKPLPSLTYEGPGTTTNDTVRLVPEEPVTSASLRQYRKCSYVSGLQIETSFYWPEPPHGPTAGYTAPLIQWVETRITGLTTDPIILHGYFSQSYHPGHHNFMEQFIFDPRLEPGLPAQQLTELAQQNIDYLVVERGDFQNGYWLMGTDGVLRPGK